MPRACPPSTARQSLVSVAHTRTALSMPPPATNRPSALSATRRMWLPGTSSTARHSPLSVAHSRIVPSRPPLASNRPSALSATPGTRLACPRMAARRSPVSVAHTWTVALLRRRPTAPAVQECHEPLLCSTFVEVCLQLLQDRRADQPLLALPHIVFGLRLDQRLLDYDHGLTASDLVDRPPPDGRSRTRAPPIAG
jgi:hypothetical protein